MERLLELDFSTFAQLGNGQLERQVQKLIRQVKFTAKVTVDLECETQEIVVQLLPGELKRATEYSLECVRTKLGTNLDGATLIAGQP